MRRAKGSLRSAGHERNKAGKILPLSWEDATEEEIDEIFADDITDDGGITRLCTIGRHGTACIVELGAA